jgi:hypothetical protein
MYVHNHAPKIILSAQVPILPLQKSCGKRFPENACCQPLHLVLKHSSSTWNSQCCFLQNAAEQKTVFCDAGGSSPFLAGLLKYQMQQAPARLVT